MKKIFLLILLVLFLYAIYCLSKELHWYNSSKIKKYSYSSTLKNWYIKIIKHHIFKYPLNKKVCHENLSLIHEVMEKLKIDFWISDGTALGFMREKDFITYDNDVDIGFFSKDQDKFWDNINLFEKQGFEIAEIRDQNTFLVFLRKGEKIDIDITGKGLICDQCNNTPCENILPYLETFDKINIKGKKYNMPKEDYILYKYGENWRIPT